MDEVFIGVPKNKSRLLIHQRDGLIVWFTHPMPNAWRRFWYWALLGWRWESVE